MSVEDAVVRAVSLDLRSREEHHRAVSAQAVRSVVRRAVADLRGSVRADALPELAWRLAVVRLNLPVGATAAPSSR